MHYPTVDLARVRRALQAAALLVAAAAPGWAATKGPDAGGYTATDAAVYSFVDISVPGGGVSILGGSDDGIAALTLPFSFDFYGLPRTMVCVSSNGALYFISNLTDCSHFNDFANTDLTSTSPPNDRPAVFPFWSDLTFDVPGAGAVFYQAVGAPGARRFVVQWNNAYPQGSPNPVTFQVILSEASNKILFQYKKVALGPGNPASGAAEATIGIRNAGALGTGQQLQWSFDVPVIADDSALAFSGDSTPPVTTAVLSGVLGNHGWYKGPVEVSFSASDPGGSVAATRYSLDAGSTLTYSMPFTVSGDAIHHLSFFSIDASGNQELPRQVDIKIDATPPSVTAVAQPSTLWPPNGNTVTVAVSGAVTDATSGVDPTSAQFSVIDEYGQVQPSGAVTLTATGSYSVAVPLVASRNGNDKNGRSYTIQVRAMDMAGNLRSASVVVIVPQDQGQH